MKIGRLSVSWLRHMPWRTRGYEGPEVNKDSHYWYIGPLSIKWEVRK